MKKLKIAAALMCVCFLFTAAYATSAGSSTDPLVTLSYLNGTYTEQVKAMVDQTVNERRAEMERSLREILASQGGTSTPTNGGSVFTVVTLYQGQALVGSAGCELLLRSGSAVCSAADSMGLTDITSGSALGGGGALSNDHLYIVTAGPRSVIATAPMTEMLVRGSYIIQ